MLARTIRETLGGFQSGSLTALKLMQECLERQDRLAKSLNVFAARADGGDLLEQAEAIDQRRLQGAPVPILSGLPIAIKDIYATTDLPTTASSRVLAGHRTDFDAEAVRRLRQAGAILVGKTQTHEFAYGPTTVNQFAGASHNPWDPERVPGGSSGGSAIAVATGMCLGATGSDTGGSIRTPSALCGISGLKPTYGLISRRGVYPLSWSLDHAGPMARCADDLAYMLHVMAGHDPADPGSAAVPIPAYPELMLQDPGRLRVGVPEEHYLDDVDPEVASSFEAALTRFEQQGWSVEQVSIPHLKYALGAELAILTAEACAYHRQRLRRQGEDYSDDVRAQLDAGLVLLATDYLTAQRVRRIISDEFEEVLRRVDVLATPTLPITAPRIGEMEITVGGKTMSVLNAIWRNVFPSNLTGLPTLSVPCGLSGGGLPVGLQLIGRAFDEARVLQAGHAYQQKTDWHLRMPPIVNPSER